MKRSLHKKILTLLLGSVLITVVLAGGAGIMNASRVVEADSRQIMNLTCETKTQEINTWLLDIEQSVDTIYCFADSQLEGKRELWSDEDYMEAYTAKIYDVMENVAQSTNCALSVYLRFNPELLKSTSGIFLVKKEDGTFVDEPMTDLDSYDPDDREHVGWYYEPIENGGPTWMDPYENKNIGEEMISYVIPIFRDDMVIGVIGMDIDLNLLKEKVKAISAYDSGYALLASADGDIIYSKEYPKGRKVEEFDVALRGAEDYLRGEDEGDIFSYYWHGEKRCMVFQYLENGMTLGIVAPAAEINKTRDHLVVQCVAILLAVLSVATLLGIRLTAQMTKPLYELTQAAREITKGNWNVAIRCESEDEVGVLARTLKEAIKELNRCITHISNLAYTDNLTGLHNRHYMEQYCSRYAEKKDVDVGVVFCDLNGLKYSNDHFGHAAGDELICSFAEILKESFPDDVCCRMSGDEFVVIASSKTEDEFLQMVEELRCLNDEKEVPYASIGFCWRAEAVDIDELIKVAEDGMYQDKKLFYKKFPMYRR